MNIPRISWLYLLVLGILGVTTTVCATDYRGANFISRDPVVGDYGDYKAASGSFQQYDIGGQSVIGESTSGNFILRSGFMYFNEFTARTENWRWYTDEMHETPTNSLAGEDTAPTSVVNDDTLKLRWTVRELAGISSASFKLRLEYSTQADFASDVHDVVEIGACAASSTWCYADGVDADGALLTTSVLSTSDACASSVGTGCGTHNESGGSASSRDHRFSAAIEYEFTLKPAGPLPNTVYYFRAVPTQSARALVPFTGKTYPSLMTESATLSFTILGVSSGTATEGTVTDATTSATAIPFGALVVDVPKNAAQKLRVTTNAPNGYTVFAYRFSPMMNGAGDTIGDVGGTNAVPVAWAIPGGQQSATGYHSGDGQLSGGSVRFSADDSYAALESVAREIIYSSGPVLSEETDVVFRIEVQPLQPAGSYHADMGYIAVPVF